MLHSDFGNFCNIYKFNCFVDVEKTSVNEKGDDGTGDEEEKKSGSDSEDDR